MELEDLTWQYLQTAAREWATLEAGDATVPLTDVFVLLEAVERPRPRHTECPPDLAALTERLEHAHPSPVYGGGAGGGGLHPAAEAAGGGVRVPIPLSHALRESRHLVLLGEPGAGKTTTLQYIALWFAARAVAQADRLHADLGIDELCVPVRLDLRLLALKLPASGAALEEALAGEVDGFLRKGLEVARDLVRHWRDSGRLLPLLDGLDEVAPEQREEVRREISRFAASPDGSRCRVVVASRIAGYAPLGGDFREYTLKPFQKAEEARDYLAGWLAWLRPEWAGEARVRADQLLEEMGRTALHRVTDNPLLLRMAAELYARRGEVARSRAELYRRWVEEEAWARALRRGARPEERERALGLLEEVAWALQNGLKFPELSPEEKSLLRERMGLLARLEEDRLVFAHRTFQEYFVARHLARAWRENRPGAWAFLRPRLHIPEWREPLLLLAGELEGPEATDLVWRVLRAHRGLGEDARYERYLRRDFILALRLAGEARGFPRKVLEPLLARARRLLGWEAVPSGLRIALTGALSTLPADNALPILLEALRDTDENVRWAAAKALGRIGAPAVPALLDALKDASCWVCEATVWVLGEIGDPRAVPSLLEILKSEDNDVRRIRAVVPRRVGGARTCVFLRALNEERKRAATAKALGRIGDPWAVTALLEALRDEDVRWAAAEALGRIGALAVPALLEALRDANWRVRQAAAEALGEIGDPQAVPALSEALRDANDSVRLMAAVALRKIDDFPVVPIILEALRDADVRVRLTAAEALCQNNKPWAIPALLEALKDADEDVRGVAVLAFEGIGASAVPALLKALKDADENVRRAAAEALGRIGNPQAVPALLEALRDEDVDARRAAVEALGRIGDPRAVPALLEALKDENVRWAAVEALGRIGDPRAVSVLLEALMDLRFEWWLRETVVWALGEISDFQTISVLIRALSDTERVPQTAAGALGNIARALKPATEEKERREQAVLLRRAARALYQARRRVDVYEALQAVLEKWEALTLRYRDPFAPLPVQPAVRVARAAGLALAVGFLLAVLALLGLLSGAAGDLLKEQAQALLRVYPFWALALLVALLAALAGGLSWALDRLRKR